MASKGDALVAGNISQVPAYLKGLGKEAVQEEFKKQTDIFVKNDVDFLIGEVNMPYCRYFTSGAIQQTFFCQGWGLGRESGERKELKPDSVLSIAHVL